MLRTLIPPFLVTLLFLISSPVWGESVTVDDLVEREDIFYKKFSDVPFTGEVTGRHQGTLKDGIRIGTFLEYYENGQLELKRNYKDGVIDGLVESFHENGQLKSGENYKGGKLDGISENFNVIGTLTDTRVWKDGEILSHTRFKYYYENGQLKSKENFKDGERILSQTFTQHGKRLEDLTYTKGIKTGVEYQYHDNGQLRFKGNYKDGERD